MNKHRRDSQSMVELYEGVMDKVLSKFSNTGMGQRASERVALQNDQKIMKKYFNTSPLSTQDQVMKQQLVGWLNRLTKLDATTVPAVNNLPDVVTRKEIDKALPQITQELRILKSTGSVMGQQTQQTQPAPAEPVGPEQSAPDEPEQPEQSSPDEPEQPDINTSDPDPDQAEMTADEPEQPASDEPIEPEINTDDDWLNRANDNTQATTNDPQSQPTAQRQLKSTVDRLRKTGGINMSAEDKALLNSYKSHFKNAYERNPNQQRYRISGDEDVRLTNKEVQALINSATIHEMLPILEKALNNNHGYNTLGRAGFMGTKWGRF